MCNFLSWIEYQNKLYFLTEADLKTKTFKQFKKDNERWQEDIKGHGAIRYFHPEIKNVGINRECSDFSNKDNFPLILQNAIKNCVFGSISIETSLLSTTAKAIYEKIEKSALAEYEKIEQPAHAKYDKIRQLAKAEYEKIGRLAKTEYKKKIESAWAEYKRIEQPAWTEYKKIRQLAMAKYDKRMQSAFRKLFFKIENRIETWK